MTKARTEAGQTTVLILGLAVVLIMMLAVVVDASAAYLRRQGLDSLADGAALTAADGIQGRLVYEGGLGKHAQIDPVMAQQLVASYLSATGAAEKYPGLSYSVETTADRVVVRIAAPLQLPIRPPGWDDSAVIRGTAASFVAVSN